MDYTRFVGKNHSVLGNPIRSLDAKVIALCNGDTSHLKSMHIGQPNMESAPIKEVTMQLHGDMGEVTIAGDHLHAAMKYTPIKGLPFLRRWVRDFTVHVHNPPTASIPVEKGGLDVMVTTGNAQTNFTSLDLLVNRGDWIISEDPMYPGAMATLNTLGCQHVTVKTDADGMDPEDLLKSLRDKWSPDDALNPESDVPKVIFSIPTCSNPTGSSISEERKRQIYKIAQDYNMLIIEDDPYYFLQSGKRVPSFLSMDVDGRVIRGDSFSKTVGPGIRMGFCSGPAPLLDLMSARAGLMINNPSGMGQAMVYGLLQKWGIEGYLRHCDKIVGILQGNLAIALHLAEKYLTGLAEWDAPQGGMYFWVKLTCITDSLKLTLPDAVNRGVIWMPGYAFNADLSTSSYIRMSFALLNEEDMEKVFAVLGDLLNEAKEKGGN